MFTSQNNIPLPPLVFPAVSLASGIAAGSLFAGFSLLSFLAAVLFFTLYFLAGFSPIQKRCSLFLIPAVFFSGFWLISSHLNSSADSDHISQFTGKREFLISGTVVSTPSYSRVRTKVVLGSLKIENNPSVTKTPIGRIRVYIYGTPREIRYGDRLKFEGTIKQPRNFSNPGGFDYKKYLAFKNIWGISYTNIREIRFQRMNHKPYLYETVLRKINRLRFEFADAIEHQLENGKAAAILTALTTGLRDTIPDQLRLDFSKAGASHIIAISGLHLSIVALLFFFVFNTIFSFFKPLIIRGWSAKAAAFATLFPLGFYAVLSGFSPSTQRAFIMIVIFMFTYVIDREKDILNSLAAAGIIILLIYPVSLYSISFQLSFTAVFFIILGIYTIKYNALFTEKTVKSRIVVFLIVSVCATIGTVPIVMYYFHIVSFVQVLTNVIIIPVIGFFVVPLGIVALFVYPVLKTGAILFIKLTEPVLSFCIAFVELTASNRFAWSRCVTPDSIEMVCYYILIFGIFLLLCKRYKKGTAVVMVTVAVFLIHTFFVLKARYHNSELSMTVLDVGQGSSTFIRAPHGVGVLVDGGGFSYGSTFDTGQYIVAPFLWDQRFLALDAVILTHPESDHMNGLIYILNNFQVKRLVKNLNTRDTKSYAELMRVCKEKKIPVITVPGIYNEMAFDDTSFQFLYPYDGSSANLNRKGYNNNSIVFRLLYNQFSMLFPGDIMADAEAAIVTEAKEKLRADLMLSPHHGSATSSSQLFLKAVDPKGVVVSCGWNNRYGFPCKAIISRYRKRAITVFRTDLDGAVIIESDGETYGISTFK